jgi:hypothetical protein
LADGTIRWHASSPPQAMDKIIQLIDFISNTLFTCGGMFLGISEDKWNAE